MTGKWELNGLKLGNSDATVVVTALESNRSVRQAFTALEAGGEDRQRQGLDKARLTVEFTILGSGTQKFNVLDSILDTVEGDNTWTLQSPRDNDNVYVYRDHRRAALATQSANVNIVNRVKIVVRVDAVVDGVWIADGGEYCEAVTGYFTLTSTGPNSYTREDGTVTGTTPLVRLPEQTSGYPLAVRASDFAEAQPTLSATVSETTTDGYTIFYEDYDFTGFLIPAPSTAGDVGLYEVCSSPTDAFLSGGEGLIATVNGGMASFAMASNAMAST